jgi:hypothetical protein
MAVEAVILGAGDGIRTRDIDLGKVALYQLSYSRPWKIPFSVRTFGLSNVYEITLKIRNL